MEESEELFIIFIGKLEVKQKNIRFFFHKIINILLVFSNFRVDDCLKVGTLIGEDKYGNKYYQNNRQFYGKIKNRCFFFKFDTDSTYIFCHLSGRNRWVIYNPNVGVEYDGSMIPQEWFGWMHYKTDLPPTEV